MSDSPGSTGLATSQKYLGRRLRPWWGRAPGSLAFGGLIGALLFGFLVFKVLEFTGDDESVADIADNLDYSSARVRTIALVIAGILGLIIALNVIKIVVGAFDLFVRRTHEGVVTAVEKRRPEDFLPAPVRLVLRFRRRRRGNFYDDESSIDRRMRQEIIIDTGSGLKAWNTRKAEARGSLHGRRVRVTVTPLLGYVRKVEPLEPAAAADFGAHPLVGTQAGRPPAGWTDSSGDDGGDVLSEIPGYEHHRGSKQNIPGLDQLRRIPGLGGLVDKIPTLDDVQRMAEEAKARAEGAAPSETPGSPTTGPTPPTPPASPGVPTPPTPPGPPPTPGTPPPVPGTPPPVPGSPAEPAPPPVPPADPAAPSGPPPVPPQTPPTPPPPPPTDG